MRFLNDTKIVKKLPALIVLCAAISTLIIGTISNIKASESDFNNQENKLLALEKVRVIQLSNYLDSIKEDLGIIASNPYILDALNAYSASWRELQNSGNPTQKLQDLYIRSNPNPLGEKDKLIQANDGSTYSKRHGEFHPWFKNFLYARNYYDVFLVDDSGNVVYSVYKENDFATNLNNGAWKDTDLGKAYRSAMNSAGRGEMYFYDFKPYAPSNNAPASFISTAITDENGVVKGALIFQMPIGRINAIMQQSEGMGKSGETYIVGNDMLMRSDSRFSDEPTILKTKVDTVSTRNALKGQTGVELVKDYRGIDVLSAYSPFDFMGTKWAVIAEIDKDEVLQNVVAMRNQAIITAIILLTLIVITGIQFAKLITKPLSELIGAMETLSKGDTSVTVPQSDRLDEIGDMAKALEVFKQNRIEADRLAEEQAAAQEKQNQRALTLEQITKEFEDKISEMVGALTASSTQLGSTAQSMSSIAEETSAQSKAMTSASESTAANIQTVASAAEELSASIRELSAQVNNTSSAANEATLDVDKASKQIESLIDASEKIGDVVNLIQEIAEQTNLLALNATIESARAGDAGKGFAVVANEVKALANETSKATEQISTEVNTVQTEIRNAVSAIRSIEEKIRNVNESASVIAAAIEEQNATTEEISRSTQTSAANVGELNQNAQGVNEAASTTGEASSEVLHCSQDLSKQTENLKMQVDAFLAKVKAA